MVKTVFPEKDIFLAKVRTVEELSKKIEEYSGIYFKAISATASFSLMIQAGPWLEEPKG